MAEHVKKHPKNVPGRYYVNCEECMAHFLCVYLAPDNFRSDDSGEYGLSPYVFKQPETPEEEKRCREALEACPVPAIYDDGEDENG